MGEIDIGLAKVRKTQQLIDEELVKYYLKPKGSTAVFTCIEGGKNGKDPANDFIS